MRVCHTNDDCKFFFRNGKDIIYKEITSHLNVKKNLLGAQETVGEDIFSLDMFINIDKHLVTWSLDDIAIYVNATDKPYERMMMDLHFLLHPYSSKLYNWRCSTDNHLIQLETKIPKLVKILLAY